MRQSIVSREAAQNDALAEFRDAGQKSPMSAKENSRRAAVRAFMVARNLKVKPWTAAAGIAESGLRAYLKGGPSGTSSMTYDALDRLAAAADATVAELVGEKVPIARIGKDMVTIKSLEVRASMGGGFEVIDEPAGPPFFFRRQWIEQILGGRPGQLRILPLGGDSMVPTINNGDVGLVLFPSEDTKFQSGAVYAVWDGQGLIAKRLESKVGGDRPKLRVISDNKTLEPYDVDAEDVRIIGQIIWRGGRI